MEQNDSVGDSTSKNTQGLTITLFALRNPLQKLYYLKQKWLGLSSTFIRHLAQVSATAGAFYSIPLKIG